MVRKWRVKLILTLSFILIGLAGFSQNKLVYRFAANSGMFLKEKNSSEILDPTIILVNIDGVDDFKSKMKVGFELEISVPISDLFSIGLEFENYSLKGVNENPVYYNYFATKPDYYTYMQQPLIYNTNINSIVGNVRYFPLGIRIFQPFIKVFGGVSFVGTDLQFYKSEDQAIADPIYSRGSRLSTETRWSAFYFGTGLGFQYSISEYAAIYLDASVSIVATDLLNGVPNFSYNEKTGDNENIYTSSFASQFSLGITYSIFKASKNSGDSSSKKSFKKRKGRIDKYFPFHEIKR